jgi:branched-chain amino acid transport system permease protein
MTAITTFLDRTGLKPRNWRMATRYEDDLRPFRTPGAKLGLVLLLVGYYLAPRVLSDFWLLVFNYAGVAAIGAIGLNLLTGYTGQVSLGHAAFIGAGAYVAADLGVQHGLSIFVWLPAAFVVGAVVGTIIGPAALRLRGDYLAIITLGLVFLGGYLWDNWESLTGGGTGTSTTAPVKIGSLDFADLHLAGQVYTRNQGLFWLIWGVVLIVALLARNLVRSRPGRALQAVRDRDVAAEVVGVSLARYKVGAFAISSGLAAVAGALYGVLQGTVFPSEWTLVLSITYIAMIIVGGIGTIYGSIIGAVVITAIPRWIENYSASHDIPLVSTGPTDHGWISVSSLNVVIFGVLIVVFLLVEPLGLAALWVRVKTWFKTWPFSY